MLHAVDRQTKQLSKLACKSSLFDDPAKEIGEISGAVRDRLASVAAGLEALAAERSHRPQISAHSDLVLQWLRTRVGALTEDFQAALKQREATISARS